MGKSKFLAREVEDPFAADNDDVSSSSQAAAGASGSKKASGNKGGFSEFASVSLDSPQ